MFPSCSQPTWDPFEDATTIPERTFIPQPALPIDDAAIRCPVIEPVGPMLANGTGDYPALGSEPGPRWPRAGRLPLPLPPFAIAREVTATHIVYRPSVRRWRRLLASLRALVAPRSIGARRIST